MEPLWPRMVWTTRWMVEICPCTERWPASSVWVQSAMQRRKAGRVVPPVALRTGWSLATRSGHVCLHLDWLQRADPVEHHRAVAELAMLSMLWCSASQYLVNPSFSTCWAVRKARARAWATVPPSRTVTRSSIESFAFLLIVMVPLSVL